MEYEIEEKSTKPTLLRDLKVGAYFLPLLADEGTTVYRRSNRWECGMEAIVCTAVGSGCLYDMNANLEVEEVIIEGTVKFIRG